MVITPFGALMRAVSRISPVYCAQYAAESAVRRAPAVSPAAADCVLSADDRGTSPAHPARIAMIAMRWIRIMRDIRLISWRLRACSARERFHGAGRRIYRPLREAGTHAANPPAVFSPPLLSSGSSGIARTLQDEGTPTSIWRRRR
jgi:hypothetical protein